MQEQIVTRFKRFIVWMCRICYCRGFGVQSPWAYRFVRYVINEHYPYYAYKEIEKKTKGESVLTHKLGRLYLRIANHVQPKEVVQYGNTKKVYDMYFKAGCRKSRQIKLTDDTDIKLVDTLDNITLMRITPEGDYRRLFNKACMKAIDGSVFIIEGIRSNKEAKQFWRETVSLLDGVVTFDLYYCGIVCFEKKLFKRNYIINF